MGSDPNLSLDLILVFLTSLLILLGLLEKSTLNRALSRIPIRIHVNGTRGKSSVTRLIAAGLRRGGIKTIAKTTGTCPRVIREDGSEVPVKRRGKANIKEQIGVIRMASRRGAQVIVLECNAIQPENQWVSEHRILKSTLGVMTNVRRDHTDAMGQSLGEIARCLSNTIPLQGVFISGERQFFPTFREKASSLQTKAILAEDTEMTDWPEGERHSLFPENVALSLKVCEYLGVEREIALRGMLEASPDPGALHVVDFDWGGKEIRFVNAFSANDPESTDFILEFLARQSMLKGQLYGILNNRKDRVLRALEFAGWIAERDPFQKVFIVGDLTRIARREALKHGADKARWIALRSKNPGEVMRQILDSITGAAATLVGIGNYGGLGQEIAGYLEEMKR